MTRNNRARANCAEAPYADQIWFASFRSKTENQTIRNKIKIKSNK